jgi:membrane dipeptidase
VKIFDLHCDTATELYSRGLSFENGETHISAATAKGLELTQCFAVFIPDGKTEAEATALLEGVKTRVFPQLNRKGIRPILTVEGAGELAASEAGIQRLCRAECRMASLVWNGKNRLATGAVTDDKAPLTDEGAEAVKNLIAAGITVDLSHLSAAGTEQILTLTDRPVVASHSNAKAVRNVLRNLTDEAATEIFRRGGLVGLNLFPPFLAEGEATLADLLRHAEHFLALGGENGLALGCDLDGVDALPRGIRNLGDLPKIFTLFSEAFGTPVAEKIFYGNAARFFGLE